MAKNLEKLDQTTNIQPHVFSSKLKTITFVHGGRDTHKLNMYFDEAPV